MPFVSIVRATPATFATIHSYFVWDHQRLDGQLADVMVLLDHGDLERARRLFAHYERGMQRHMRIEESVLFQTIASERTGSARLTPALVQEDHGAILGVIEAMTRALADEDVPAFRRGHEKLVGLLPAHNEKEEEALYPLLDALVGAEEAERIVTRLRSE
jgi:hemerythrin-like domain-containing protein